MLENNPNILAMDAKRNGKICITSNPTGALIYIDGIVAINPTTGEAKRSNACIDVQEGRRDITLRMDGYSDHVAYADIFPGKTTNISINMEGQRGKATTPL